MATTLKALEISLYWQEVVFKQSKDQKQIQRAELAIKRLKEEIANFKHTETIAI